MASDNIRLEYKGLAFASGGRIDIGRLHDNERKTYRIRINNKNKTSMTGLKLKTNLPKRAYTAILPSVIGPGKTESVAIELIGAEVFKFDEPSIHIEIGYMQARRFG